MKRIFYLLFSLPFVCTQVQAKAVKLEHNINATTSYQSMIKMNTSSGSTEITKPPEQKDCDANCQKCDDTTGTCLSCLPERYISGNLCLLCPEKNYCDGETAIPNCTGVSCLSNAVAEATDTGCYCMLLD